MMKVLWFTIFIVTMTCGCSRLGDDECQSVDLLLDTESVPHLDEAGQVFSPMPDAPTNSAGRTYYLNQGIATHDVRVFGYANRAAKEVDRFRRELMSINAPDSDWYLPVSLENFKPHADEFLLACGGKLDFPICRYVAHYNQYYIYFIVHLRHDEITYNEVEELLWDIDEIMLSCLSEEQ